MDRTHPTRRAERALDAGLDYARQVAGGDLAAHPWTRAAAHRFEHDIAEAEVGGRWVFDRDHALRPIAFAAEMLKVEGARMILTPWQSWITAAIFGFVDGERGVRRIRQAVILAGDPAAHVALVAALALSAVFCEGGKSGEAFASPVVVLLLGVRQGFSTESARKALPLNRETVAWNAKSRRGAAVKSRISERTLLQR